MHRYMKSRKMACECESCSVVSDSVTTWNSPGQNAGVGSHSLLQGIFPIQGSNPGLPHCRQILCQLSHKGIPRILEWVAYPLSRVSSLGIQTQDWTFNTAVEIVAIMPDLKDPQISFGCPGFPRVDASLSLLINAGTSAIIQPYRTSFSIFKHNTIL